MVHMVALTLSTLLALDFQVLDNDGDAAAK